MGDFYNCFIHEERRKKCEKSVPVYVGADTVGNGDIHARTFLYGKGAADNMSLRRIERGLLLLAVRIVGSSLEVESDNTTISDVVLYPVHRGHTFIFCIHA